MMSSSSISAHDLLDHPFPGIQIVTQNDHHDHVGHYSHDWVLHHHHQLDQQVVSDDGLNQVITMEKGIETWWGQKDDLYDPSRVDIGSDDIHDNWLPSSKLRVVRKMNPKRATTANSVPTVETNVDDRFPYFVPENDSSSNNSGNNGNNNGIRVCSDCNTAKTPLWRSGPRGPKSLCNACGIRQRKARKALALAAASASASAAAGGDNNVVRKTTASSPEFQKINISYTKDQKSSTTGHDNNWQQPDKKRLKQFSESPYTSASRDSNPSNGKDHADDQYCVRERNNNKEMCFEEFITTSLSKNASLHRVFPQDEKEAAILLMALSCGLVIHN